MYKKENIIFDIQTVGESTVLGEIAKYFYGYIPKKIFGWDKKNNLYNFIFIVPEEAIEEIQKQCADIELNSFRIVSNKGMIIGG